MLVLLRQVRASKLQIRRFSDTPKFFTASHEWVQDEGHGVARIGISSFAQEQLGEIVYCDLPAIGSSFGKGQTVCTLESVKAVGEVYTPMDGEVIEVNEGLASQPNLVNTSPEDEGWLIKLKYGGGAFSDFCKSWKDPMMYKDSLQH